MKTFIKVTEIWIPNVEHSHLVLNQGIYGDYQNFLAISEPKKFAYDQGLPGKAWACGHPIVLTDLDNSYFERKEAAREAGLTCAIGYPIFAGEFLLAVIVFLCGDDDEHAGAIEVWGNDPNRGNELGVIDGYYGCLEDFEFISRKTKIMKGYGLPGTVWERSLPVLLDDLGQSSSFIRGRDAQKAGITTGLGIPIVQHQEQIYIMVFLSAMKTPITRKIQIWLPDPSREKLICHDSFGYENEESPHICEGSVCNKGKGLVGNVWLSGIPMIEAVQQQPGASPTDPKGTLAIPVIDSGSLTAVVTLVF